MHQRFTTQQQRIAKFISQLLNDYKGDIQINFMRKTDVNSRNGESSKAFINSNRKNVVVNLIEAESSFELDLWAEVLTKAEELLQQLQNERLHELDTPDFFRYVILANCKVINH